MTARAKASGSTHRGLGEWLFMRLSAVYMAAFTLYVLVYWAMAGRLVFATWHAWFANGAVRIGWALFIGMALLHGWFGLRSVFMDYVKPIAARMAVLSLAGLGLLALALWAAAILLGVRP